MKLNRNKTYSLDAYSTLTTPFLIIVSTVFAIKMHLHTWCFFIIHASKQSINPEIVSWDFWFYNFYTFLYILFPSRSLVKIKLPIKISKSLKFLKKIFEICSY